MPNDLDDLKSWKAKPGFRSARHACLVQAGHICTFCGTRAEHVVSCIGVLTACCAQCGYLLRNMPKTWTVDDCKAYLSTITSLWKLESKEGKRRTGAPMTLAPMNDPDSSDTSTVPDACPPQYTGIKRKMYLARKAKGVVD